MSVKTIFRVLLGTIVTMVMISVLVEFFNIHITGAQLRQMTKMSANQACALFTQETYKTKTGQGATRVSDVYAADGNVYISGNFYNGMTSASAIWDSIFDKSSFKDFCNSSGRYDNPRLPSGYSTMTEAYPDLKLMQMAVQYHSNVPIPSVPSWDADENSSEVKAYNDALKAQTYYESMYTTVNLGIPYMDDEIVNKMFRWNLAQILSSCKPGTIQVDEDGNYFVNYKGFRCYAKEAKITEYEYKVYDLTNSGDRQEFKKVSNMDWQQYNLFEASDNDDDREDNNLVAVVGIKYQIPISYVGITPIKKVFNYVWNQEVGGFNGQEGGYTPRSWANENVASVGNGVNDGIEYLQAGGINGSNSGGKYATVGNLTYILVR